MLKSKNNEEVEKQEIKNLKTVNTSIIEGFNSLEQFPLLKMFEKIKNGDYHNRIFQIRKIVEQNHSADDLKRRLPAFTPCCEVKNGFTKEHIVKYNGLMILDFDKIQKNQYSEAFEKIKTIPYTYMAFRSPSGNGIKIIVPIDSEMEAHSIAFNQVGAYYSEKLDLALDKSGKNPNRLCYVSDDPDAFLNDKCKIFPVEVGKQSELMFTVSNLDISKWDKAIRWVTKKHKYLRGERNNYIHYLACCCNRLGLDYDAVLDKILREFPHENPQEIKKSIQSGYANTGEFNTFYKTAEIAEIAEIATLQEEDDHIEAPFIPEEIYSQLPDLLIKATDAFEEQRQKDIFLTGALGVLSGCFNSIFGYYDGDQVYANLYSYVSAPAASGKGALTHSRTLALKYHDYIRNQTQLGKAESLLFIPGNSSSAAMLAHLNENGGKGIFFETESDTISNSMKQEWGNFSDILRKAFHHEPVTSTRKLNKEYFQLDNPRLSVVLSGTPNQVQSLIQSAENGLFSRFLFYSFSSPAVWRDVSPKRKIQNLKDFFNEIGDHVFEIINDLNQQEAIEFKLSDKQWAMLNRTQADVLKEFTSYYGDNSASIAKRMGIMWFRIAMILTALRNYNNINEEKELICSDLDFEIAMKLMSTYKIHIINVYQSLPKQSEKAISQSDHTLLKALPNNFSRKVLLNIADDLGIPNRTADDIRKRFQQQGLIESFRHGYFRKMK